MQLKRLYIKDFKLFKDFTYEFPADSRHFINVLIGINGSGKSTILEALSEIFSCVVLGEKAKFGFELEYLFAHNFNDTSSESRGGIKYPLEIFIRGYKDKKPELFLKPSDAEEYLTIPKFNNYKKYTPGSIVIYYSGSSEIMSDICIPHNNRLSENFRKGIVNESNLIYYYEPKLFNLIMLSLLSYEFGDIPEYLKQKAKITGFNEIVITLKKPYWANDNVTNFWGAKGEIRDFLNFLDSISTKDTSSVDSKGMLLIETSSDHHIDITIFGNKLFEIKDYLAQERYLFRILYTMYLDDLLDEIDIQLIQNDNGEQLIFNNLSEGEQQAITIKGLTELLTGENALFLFDEPDTFLHPKWQRSFISEIEENVELNHANEISYLIATHSPQILSNANPEKTFVKIIEDGQLVEQTPKHYGREISSILYNLMGVEERNEIIRKDLSKLFMLIEDEDIGEAEKELERLSEILGETDADIQNAAIQLNYLKEE